MLKKNYSYGSEPPGPENSLGLKSSLDSGPGA